MRQLPRHPAGSQELLPLPKYFLARPLARGERGDRIPGVRGIRPRNLGIRAFLLRSVIPVHVRNGGD